MPPELEELLKAYDAFRQSPDGPEAARLYSIFETKLEEIAQSSKLGRETIENAVRRFYPRWVRANLPPGFPKKLGLE